MSAKQGHPAELWIQTLKSKKGEYSPVDQLALSELETHVAKLIAENQKLKNKILKLEERRL
jgi:hypothetical protein